ncbi:MAG TPA: transporter substrate-binding domain-containing protein, partial [Kiritimatiellia bacterium]|nr:transporter substrate-binding domain-containing protein [Kiritimatiellia bacterium]
MHGERQFRGAGWSRLPLLLLLGTLTALSATSCRSLLSRPQPQPVLRIGIVPDSPPLAFRQKRQWCGVEADLGRALAQRLDMRPVFIATPPARLADNLLSGKVDILMAGLTVTEERRTQMDFATPYVSVGQAAIIRAEDRLRYNTAIKIRTARTRVGAIA